MLARMSGPQRDGSVRPVHAPLISPQIGIGRPRKAPLSTSSTPGAHHVREHVGKCLTSLYQSRGNRTHLDIYEARQ